MKSTCYYSILLVAYNSYVHKILADIEQGLKNKA